jgi:hypothetical protein
LFPAVINRWRMIEGTGRLVDSGELRAILARAETVGRLRPVIRRVGVGPDGQREMGNVEGAAGDPARRFAGSRPRPSLLRRSSIVNLARTRVS